MVPFLLILTAKESYYSTLWKLVRAWSYLIIYGMGFRIKRQIDQELDRNQSYLFCPNHSSLLDPFVLMALSKNPIVFVGKKELVKIPVFGFFYKRVVIMVDRSSPKSRRRVFEMAKKRLEGGTSIGIFPEGLVPENEVILASFKKGAFSLAIEHQIPIVPQTYYDNKRLFSWDVFKGGTGKLRIRQHSFIETKGLKAEDLPKLKERAFQILYNELSSDELYMKDTKTEK
ncbi:MAG: 1-acyl-sn-glycerol-3-phosphate acyltransferase [Flavobacteriaceae bacterium]|nr:1-acyl-sn-glycerol-3-phosphate acyltransferase [Flavobacteriaceae bacterium]